jgi:hypothetical protein
LALTITTSNYYSSQYHAYYKASLIKIVGILIKDTILSFYVSVKLELVANNLVVLIEGSLIVVLLIKLNFKLRGTLYKGCSLVNAN